VGGRRWPRYLTLIVGLSGFAAGVAQRGFTGQSADPTLISASIALTGLGLGMSLDWWRRR
jgi:hypothetical protein